MNIFTENPPSRKWKNARGHRLQDHPQNPLQNSSKCANHTIRNIQRTQWSPWDGNASINIPKSHLERISTPGPSSTSSSSVAQCICSRSTKVYATSCGPCGPVAPSGEHVSHTEAATPGVNQKKILQGSVPIIYQLLQPHTGRAHPEPAQWSWENITHVHWRKWTEDESRMVSPRSNVRFTWTHWRRGGVCGSCKDPNTRGGSSKYFLPTDA